MEVVLFDIAVREVEGGRELTLYRRTRVKIKRTNRKRNEK